MSAILSAVESVILTGAGGLFGLPSLNDIGGVTVDTTIRESYDDTIEITEHPVETGSPITDHSFKRPMEVLLECGWSDSSVNAFAGSISNLFTGEGSSQSGGQWAGGTMAASDYVSGIYSQLLQLQESREPFALVTGLRVYDNMLIRTLRVERDQRTQAVLMARAHLQQVIFVSTTDASVPPQSSQANPASTADTVNAGAQQTQPDASPSPGGAVDLNSGP